MKGIQRHLCKRCGSTKQEAYSNRACLAETNTNIVLFLKEGVGIRSISRILKISTTTVLKRIISISRQTRQPPVLLGREYEVDELITYIGSKKYRVCLTYAIDRKTKDVVSFSVGRRTKKTLGMVVNTLLLSEAKEIRTDRLSLYLGLIPKEIHHV
ncbi:IS1 family transposase, partial [Wandonia haliotis]|uniref:IS1 family transposase n=1 Tax=Wandonia haliotis TaxID=574963 RepID=UPI0031D6DEB5